MATEGVAVAEELNACVAELINRLTEAKEGVAIELTEELEVAVAVNANMFIDVNKWVAI